MVLAFQYESWSLPLAILLIVPMCLLSALLGLWLMGLDNNIFAQIGFVVLIGLAAKNAILVVEFSKQLEDQGRAGVEAVVEACAHAAAPDPDDILRLHPGRVAAGVGQGRRRRDARAAGRGRVGRHDRRDLLRPGLHAGLLLDHHAAGQGEAAGVTLP